MQMILQIGGGSSLGKTLIKVGRNKRYSVETPDMGLSKHKLGATAFNIVTRNGQDLKEQTTKIKIGQRNRPSVIPSPECD